MASMCQFGRNSAPGRSTPNVYSINDAKSVASTARNAARAETCIGAMLVASSVMSYLSKRLKCVFVSYFARTLAAVSLWGEYKQYKARYHQAVQEERLLSAVEPSQGLAVD